MTARAWTTTGTDRLMGSVAGRLERTEKADTLVLDMDAVTFDDTTDGTPVTFGQGADIASGKLLTWLGDASPVANREVGWSANRLRYHDGTSERIVAHTAEVSGGGGGATIDTFANVPGSPGAGDLHIATDSQMWRRFNGSTWDALAPGRVAGIATPPQAGSFSWVNQGASTAVNTTGPLVLTAAAEAGTNLRMLVASYSGVFRWSAAMEFISVGVDGSRGLAGIVARRSSTGAAIALFQSGNRLIVNRLNSATSYGAAPLVLDGMPKQLRHVQIYDDNVDSLHFLWSHDGIHYETLYSETWATFLGGKPDQYGVIAVSQNSSALDCVVDYYHLETATS